MRKLILLGDSNTYGYDPRGFMGGRYPEEARWTTMVRKALADFYEVVEEGMNGRQLPDVKYGFFTSMLAELDADDVVVMMLGTNDILLTYNPDAKQAAIKMERVLEYVTQNFKGKFIMIAPPYIEAIESELQRYKDASVEMNQLFMELAEKYGIVAFDASKWDIPMGYDGVHFSIEGHKLFAEKLMERL
jgi:lysophospholipase L1-like esterase